MKKYIVFILGLFLIVTACKQKSVYESADEMVEEASKQIKAINVEDVHQLLNSDSIFTLVDVRQKSEHYYGFIPGSVVIPRGSLEFKISDSTFWNNEGLYMPLKEELIIVYCKKGRRGTLAAQTLQNLGYKNVFSIEGGWKKWELTYPDEIMKDLEKLSGGAEEHDDGGGC